MKAFFITIGIFFGCTICMFLLSKIPFLDYHFTDESAFHVIVMGMLFD